MQQSSKRRRVAQDTVTVTWRAKNTGTAYAVVLSAAGDDDECVISCENINSARLEFVPEPLHHIFSGNPALRKATLPCGHAFAALPLAYHYLKNSMRCPVCRSGEDNSLNARSIPVHVRKLLTTRVHETVSREMIQQRQEEHTESMASIRRILAEQVDTQQLLQVFTARRYPPAVDVNFQIYTNSEIPDYSMRLGMRLSYGTENVYVLSRAHFREMNRHFASSGARAFAVSISWPPTTTMDSSHTIELSRTPLIRLPFFTLNDDNVLEWDPHNRELMQHDTVYARMRVFGMDPTTLTRQESAVEFEHGPFALGSDAMGTFLPFHSMRWVPASDIADVIGRFQYSIVFEF